MTIRYIIANRKLTLLEETCSKLHVPSHSTSGGEPYSEYKCWPYKDQRRREDGIWCN